MFPEYDQSDRWEAVVDRARRGTRRFAHKFLGLGRPSGDHDDRAGLRRGPNRRLDVGSTFLDGHWDAEFAQSFYGLAAASFSDHDHLGGVLRDAT